MASPFSLVLHTHLPMVVNHGRWPHGSDWLNEAAFECYLPLLETIHRLVADGISPKWTFNISPVLAEQLASPEFQKELAFYYDNVRRACVESREHFGREGGKEYVRLTHFWEDFYERMWELHRRIGGDIVGTFADLQRAGHVEILTCAATHGYLPLLSRDESIHLQLRTAVETHKKHFGQAPRGIWLPECAYRPRYEWTAPTGRESGRERRLRPGIEELLATYKLEYFVADYHLLSAGAPVFAYRDYFPLGPEMTGAPAMKPSGATPRSPYATYRVASRGGTGDAIAFFRDPKTTLQVWSRDHGYPGEFHYLEFHKKHFPGGLRFWRITDASNDLGSKQVYDPEVAKEKIHLQARHFVELVQATIAEGARGGDSIVCSPYDAELFGHWWFEGPQFIDYLFRKIHWDQDVIEPLTPYEYLERQPRNQVAQPSFSSWGYKGYAEYWLEGSNDWIYRHLDHAARTMIELATVHKQSNGAVQRTLNQAARELLLAQASDWAFIMKTGTTVPYAVRRTKEHLQRFDTLTRMVRESRIDAAAVSDLEQRDNLLPAIDFRVWARR